MTNESEPTPEQIDADIREIMRSWEIAWLIDALDPTEYPLNHRIRADDELFRRLAGRN